MTIGDLPLLRGQLAPDSSLPRGASQEQARRVAQEFETVLLEQVLQQMRRANAALGGAQEGVARDVHAAWWDRALAVAVTQGGGAGLAGALEQQLVRQYGR